MGELIDLNSQIPDSRIPAGVARDTETTAAINAHVATADPHPIYLTQTEGDSRYRQSAVALADGDIPAGIARDSETTAAINAHVAAADPHAQYLLQSEGDGRYRQTAVALTDADIPAAIARDTEITAAVNAHVNVSGLHSVLCSVISTIVAPSGTETAVSIGAIPAAKIVGINAYILDDLGVSGIFYIFRGGGQDFNPATPRLTNGWIRISSVVAGSQFIGDPIHFLIWHIP